jgi:hypothetical protein
MRVMRAINLGPDVRSAGALNWAEVARVARSKD